jgi:hypothetical protein
MSTDYLQQILAREAVDTSATSPVRSVRGALLPVIQMWAGAQLLDVTPSGSFAKGTANRSGTDIDLFISLSETTTNTLADIYGTLFTAITNAGYQPTKRNVSINLRVGAYGVDLVPGKRQNSTTTDHSLYRNRAQTWTKTNIGTHINTVLFSNCQAPIRIIKLWRDQKGLDFPSFYLELLVIEALRGTLLTDLAARVVHAVGYLRDNILTSRIVDPANTNNIVSDDLTPIGKCTIRTAAANAFNGSWTDFVR